MRLAYITNIQVPAGDAQSIQVQAMGKAFTKKLSGDFLFVSPRNKENARLKVEYNWVKLLIPASLPRSIRYALVMFCSIIVVLRFKPDFIYSRDIGIAVWYKLLGFRSVYEMHKPFETKIGRWLFSLFAYKLKVIAISNAMKSYIIENYKISPARILVAHDGVFLKEFEKAREQSKNDLKRRLFSLPEDSFVVLYSGSVQPGKGVEIMEEATQKIRITHPNVKFVVIGNNNIISPTGGNITFLGRKPHSEVPYYLRAADLLLLPNTAELRYYMYTSPLKLFEYMASGTPVAASSAGSITEIANEKNAYIFNPDNPAELVQIIKRVMSNFLESETKASRALQDARKYSWPARAELLLNFLQTKI